LAPTRRFDIPRHSTWFNIPSANTGTTTPPQDEVAAGQDPPTDNEDISVEDIAEGQQEVDLLDLGISAEDIAAM
jgi:hypothetical protein